MIAVDTNLLVYAHRYDSGWNAQAYQLLTDLMRGTDAWAIPWPCVHEFLSVVTHARIYRPATTLIDAVAQVEAWLESPSLVLLGESDGYWPILRAALEKGRILGSRVHDARIAALCISHGVSELWSADRDFARFRELRVINPLT